MQENKNPTPEQQTQKPSLWRRCQQKIKDWRWELEEHPGRFSLDIQGAVARLAARLRTLVEQLPERERRLLTLRYGLGGDAPLTQQEVAARFGISRSYVSRLEKRALTELARRW